MNNKLRIGILLDSDLIPFWEFKMIEEINLSEYSELVLIVKNNKLNKKEHLIKRIWKIRRNIFYLIYLKIESFFIKPLPNAFDLKNIKSIVTCDEIKVNPRETKFSSRFSSEDLEKIKSYDIDVLIRQGFKILRGDILTVSKYGIWSYHHGDNNVNRGGPAGVWEVLENIDETGVILQTLTEDLDGGVKLAESFSATDKESINRNKNNFYWKASSILPRCLKQLYLLGGNKFFSDKSHLNPEVFYYSHKLYTLPTNFVFLKNIIKIYLKALKRKISNLFYFNQWVLLFDFSKKESLKKSFFRFKRILPPKDRFWADPFVYFRNDKYYVFFEELIYKKGKGTIAMIELDEDGKHTQSKVVLEKDYHLSYPCLFEEKGQLFMIPETATNKNIELYKCIDFPFKWQLEKVLMDNVHAVDTTILKYNNKFWLFCNIMKNKGANTKDELFLYYSDELVTDKWISHKSNPILSDVKKARPAGKIFVFNDRIYRPSQNNSKTYGYGMQIREILELNEDSYRESQIHSIYPNWASDIKATHTLNHTGKLTVIDALLKRKKY